MVGRLLLRAASSSSLHYQLGNILLMVFQSFVVPFIIGVAAFGAQMLFLAPIFLAQALLEPSYEAELNASARAGRCHLNLPSAVLQAVLLIGIAIPLTIGDFGKLHLAFLAFCQSIATLFLAALFALKDIALAATMRYVSFVAYVVAFGWMVHAGAEGEIIIANLAASLAASLVAGTVLLRRRQMTLGWGWPDFRPLLGGLSFRLPTISYTAFTTILLGHAGAPAATIGEFRIFMAAISAGRFVNLVPLARLQVAIHRFAASRDRELLALLPTYAVSLAVFAGVLTLLFPALYQLAFGEFNFGRVALLVGPLFLCAQPLGYFVFASQPQHVWFNVAFPLGISVALMAGFYCLFLWTNAPDIAVSITVGALTTAYTLAAFSVGRRPPCR